MFHNPQEDLAQTMVKTQLQARGMNDLRVLAAMLNVPRHLFIDLPSGAEAQAYADHPVSIGQGQTISQPYIVAYMTQLLDVQPGQVVLEIGLGSGYQAAVLLELGATVWSIERSAILAERTKKKLEALLPEDIVKGGRLHITTADGTLGWSEGAPYDRIIVTAGAPHLPAALRDQLSDQDGKIVIPIGSPTMQQLTLFERHEDQWKKQEKMDCRFVPLIGSDGWPESMTLPA